MRFLWNLQNLRKIGKFAKFENSLNIVQQWKRRLRGPELNLWFLWNLRKLGKHEIDNFKVAPLASVWLPAKCEAIDMKMFFYYSQYANNIHFHKLGFARSLVLKATSFETANGLFSVPCERRFLSCMAFSVYEVIRVACQSRSWFVYSPRTGTNQLRDWRAKRITSWTLIAMQERNLCSQGNYWAIKCRR